MLKNKQTDNLRRYGAIKDSRPLQAVRFKLKDELRQVPIAVSHSTIANRRQGLNVTLVLLQALPQQLQEAQQLSYKSGFLRE